ncbi:hypothetical protein IU459_13760 [Nocardia amamiensis]|uniref:Uncharacterized protein n=1 Tax=Nocardia amamiensis TaxID=404578 RepID=A0ABS0CPR8_9NOCA|nr:hypothetical protein [Nocardia amamiensis]MBF6298599.1 hypothetical protein [Nocardia amamiensis]
MQGAELAGQQVARRTSLLLASGAAPGVALAQGLRVQTGTDTLSVPIGAQVLGIGHYTLGARLRPVSVVAAPGELYLSGVQLAQGDMAPSGLPVARFRTDSRHRPDSRSDDSMSRSDDPMPWDTWPEPDHTEVVTAVARAVAQVPGNERPGRDDDYCTPGGTSSLATELARTAAEPNCPLGVRAVSTASAVADHGELVERAGGSGGASLVAQLRARPRPPLVPLSPARQRLRSRDPVQRSSASHAVSFVLGSRGPADAVEVPLTVDNPEAIAFELPELSVSPSTLDTGATTLDLQLAVTENPAGAGLGEGSAPAGIQAGFPTATPLVHAAIVAGYARRFAGLLRVITNAARSAIGAHENALAPVLCRFAADRCSLALLNLLPACVGRSGGRAPEWRAVVERHHRVGRHELPGETTDPADLLGRRLAFWRPVAAGLLAPATDHRRPARMACGYAAGKAVFAHSALVVDSEGNR